LGITSPAIRKQTGAMLKFQAFALVLFLPRKSGWRPLAREFFIAYDKGKQITKNKRPIFGSAFVLRNMLYA
jgi:hypothetical protein